MNKEDAESIHDLKCQSLELSDKDFESLISIILNPAEPNEALREAFDKHNKIVKCSSLRNEMKA